MSKLRCVVNYDFVKKTVYYKLLAKVNAIDTNVVLLKSKYNTDRLNIEKK